MHVIAQTQGGLTAPLEEGLSTLTRIVPTILAFLAILLIGYFVVKAAAGIVNRLLERVGFDRAVERGGVKKALARTEYDASDIVAKLVFYTLLLFVLQMAFGVFGPNPISELLYGVIAYLPQVIAAIVIVVIAAAIAKAAKDVITATLGGLSYGNLLGSIASGAIVVVGVFAALDTLGIAQNIVNGLFYAILAIVAGSAIIAIGGGGVQPMRRRWEHTLQRYDEEKEQVRAELDRQRDTTPARGGSSDLRSEGRTVRVPEHPDIAARTRR
jgi:hypothetical protein